MKYKLEFSQIFRRKINSLKRDLTKEYGKDKAKEAVSEIMTIANLRNSIYKLSCICDIVRVKEIIWVTPYILKIDSRKLI